jgi:hypothetical protein
MNTSLLRFYALIFFAVSVVAVAPALARHPIHASITTIDLNPRTHSFEIACKIFADDLEEAIRKATGVQLYIGSAKENPKQTAAKIEEYLRQHFRVEADGKALPRWTFVGREIEGDAVWCYLEVQNVPALKRLLVSNTALHDLHDDQTNLVNVSINGTRRSAVLRKGKEVETLEF